ncbi:MULTISPECIES: hypothetical protein [Acinetobacter]|uniref:Lipoprotein n=1 Tax=Acinetobacter chengduensis TaxID=2420890 RepID=A0ABX9TU07_9GAMM|nr:MULTISPECIES: hypothetical protein [Acinetobacter]MBI1453276.1 hypothetical protein [Acinetobacter sp. FL51]RKG41401.1 hypothetical protein D7V31_10300 [Acinetobacter sp. WCHAc060007]RLL20411.1 hypothetical protein D9K81_12210 [Acinetobacter chengduensis]
MFSFKSVVFKTTILLCSVWMLQACSNSSDQTEEKVVIKPAPKLTNDATVYANEAWKLINQVDHLVYEKQIAVLEEQVRKPVRKLSTDWRINVKMTDSVTEGKYALCRKALTSLDIWAREMLESSGDVAPKQADYERDKKQCQGAIDNPNLGNTDPKKIGV